MNIGVAKSVEKWVGGDAKSCMLVFSIVHKLKRKLSLSNNLVKNGVARATLCHTLAMPLMQVKIFIRGFIMLMVL